MLLLAAGLMLPAGLAALRDDKFAEPLVSQLLIMLEKSSIKFGNVTVSEWATSSPLPFGLAKKIFVELDSLQGTAMSLLVFPATSFCICLTSH